MKKITSAILASTILLSCVSAFADSFTASDDAFVTEVPMHDDKATVSISLAAGETKMLLNGEEIEITAPYVTDEGVTLVPLRVITEAFGADVSWNEEKQSISITYADVAINLTIGSKAAVINEHAEELESAPELTDETTMIPLRFISETFGAEVNYNDETGTISVTLSDKEESEMIRGMHDKDYIGDSFLSWNMKTPKNMTLNYRSFDSSSITFSDEYFNLLSISVDDEQETSDINSLFQMYITDGSGDVITGYEKGTDSKGNPMFSLSTKNNYSMSYYKVILADNKLYTVSAESYEYDEPNSTFSNAYNDAVAIASTFTTGVGNDMYDFSDIKDGLREYRNDDLKITFSIPQNYTEDEFASALNEIVFSSDYEESINGMYIRIYSKSETESKETLMQMCHEVYASVLNPAITSMSEITPTEINGSGDAVSFTFTATLDDCNLTCKKLAFELGEYIYYISVIDSSEEICQNIIDSLRAEELDFNKFGTIIDPATLMEAYTYNNGIFSVELPKYWTSDYYSAIYDSRTGATISDYTTEYIDEIISELKASNDIVIIEPLKWKENTFGRYPEMKFRLKHKNAPDEIGKFTGVVVGGEIVTYVYSYSELFENSIIEPEIESIIKSTKKLAI